MGLFSKTETGGFNRILYYRSQILKRHVICYNVENEEMINEN